MRTLLRSLLLLVLGTAVGAFAAPILTERALAERAIPAWHGVASVTFDAELANWDADPQPDGLALFVQPLDAWGRPAPGWGFVHAEAIAAVPRGFDEAPHGRGAVCQTIGRWTKNLGSSAPTPHGYLVKLPFPHALAQGDVASRGRLRLRLVVPGEGVFEAERDGVILLP